MKPRHIGIVTFFILINVLIIYVLFFNRKKKVEEEVSMNFVTNLKAVKFNPDTAQFNIEGYGNVTAYNALDVSSEAQGELFWGSSELKPGTKFKKGARLYSIDDKEIRYALRARKSSFINLIAAALPDIKVDFNSEYQKWEDYMGSILLNESLPTLPSWKSNKEKIFLSSRQILTEYFNIKSQEEQLEKYNFYAPYSGMISEVFVSEHSIVNPGTPLFKIIESKNFEIPVAMPSSYTDKINIGAKAVINNSSNQFLGEGTVIRMADLINQNTQSIVVYVKPENELQKTLLDGQYVKIRIKQPENFIGMRVPYTALRDDLVYVYNENDSTLTSEKVTVVHENEEGYFINGLNAGSIVITQEVINFSDSTKYGVIYNQP